MIIYTILFLIALAIIIFAFSKFKNSGDYNAIKNIILKVLTFILFFVIYYVLISIISLASLSIISHNDNSGSGLWAYSLNLGMILSPILSLITTIKLNWQKKNSNTLKQNRITIKTIKGISYKLYR